MTSTQILPHIVSKQLNEDNRKQELFEERSLIGFMSMPQPRTSYQARTEWVLYCINLVT